MASEAVGIKKKKKNWRENQRKHRSYRFHLVSTLTLTILLHVALEVVEEWD